MTVELTFDFKVERGFFWTGRFPISLMEEIGRRKNDLYKKLASDVNHPDMLIGSDVIGIDGRKFKVEFASDQRQTDLSSDVRPMRVTFIEEE